MIVRQLINYGNGPDWTFGAGKNNYLQGNAAIAQNISTRLNSFLGDCYFDVGSGVDWYNLLGSNQVLALNLAITNTILNTAGVTNLLQISSNISSKRNYTVIYTVQTVYSTVSSSFVFNPTIG